MSMLPRLKPACFYDLVIEVAIVRPGPIQGKMVHPYLRRRNGEEPIEYPSEAIRSVLEKTLGVPLFQEQVMQLAVVAAGFTPGEADQLRRAMAAWRRTGVIERFGQKLIDGMITRGLTTEFAERVFAQIRGFGEYGFPESHAASFALLVYVSAWLKRHYPAAFTVGLLNSQPMGFYAPAQIIRDAMEHGVEVRPIDINTSRWDVTLESTERADRPALRLGFRLITGLAQSEIEKVLAERDIHGPFRSIEDLTHRCGPRKKLWQRLSQADVLRSLAGHRRRSLWETLPQRHEVDLPLFAELDRGGTGEPIPPLQPLEECEEVLVDYRTVGLSLRNHPIAFLREPWNRARVVPAARLAELPHGKWVRVGGLAILRQRPSTAKGITFMTLEDETGVVNLVVRPEIWEKHRKIARLAVILLASGRLEKHGSIIHVLVQKFENASAPLASLSPSSRDFR